MFEFHVMGRNGFGQVRIDVWLDGEFLGELAISPAKWVEIKEAADAGETPTIDLRIDDDP